MMKVSRILPFTSGVDDWRVLLANPAKHWQRGFSARTLAHCWESSEEMPPEIVRLFAQSSDTLVANLQPIFAIPEFKVALPGGKTDSQNDIFVLARSMAGPVCIMVEGKVKESFGPMLKDWQENASMGKKKRLQFLLDSLGLDSLPTDEVRYQLFHRAVSAILMAQQFRAVAAVLLIHSFSQEFACWPDYKKFVSLFGVEAVVGSLQRLSSSSSMPLFGAWVVGNPMFLDC